MPMEIPKKFNVGAHTYKVYLQANAEGYRGAVGWCAPSPGYYIVVRTKFSNKKQTPEQMFQTFWHEAVHAFLFDMQHPLNKDEDFVDKLGTYIAETIKTAEY